MASLIHTILSKSDQLNADDLVAGPVVVTLQRPYQMGWQSSLRRKFAIALNDEKIQVQARNGRTYENYKNVAWVWEHNCKLVQAPAVNLEDVAAQADGEADYQMEYLAKVR